MALNTIVETGNFTGTGNNITLNFRQSIDWINIYNFTEFDVQNDQGVWFYWQRGMLTQGITYFKNGGTNNLNALSLVVGSFTEIDTSGNPVGAAVATTASSNVVRPIISTGSTAGVATGSIVRLESMLNVSNLMGIDFEVDTVNLDTDFRLRYVMANAPGAVGGAGFYRIINFDPQFYPRRRFIIDVTQAAAAVITMSVTHGYTVGQEIRIRIPAAYGMVEFNNVNATVTAINTANNTVTVDVDSTAFTAFIFPAPGAFPFTQAQVVPLGEDTGVAIANNQDILAGATDNQALLGMRLLGGVGNPGGEAADNMFWQAGVAFNNTSI